MLLRKAWIVAIAIAPFVHSPQTAAAQQSPNPRAEEVGAGQKSQANQAMPGGIEKRGGTLPAGILRTRGAPAPEPEPEPEPDPEPTGEPCVPGAIIIVNGFPTVQQCP